MEARRRGGGDPLLLSTIYFFSFSPSPHLHLVSLILFKSILLHIAPTPTHFRVVWAEEWDLDRLSLWVVVYNKQKVLKDCVVEGGRRRMRSRGVRGTGVLCGTKENSYLNSDTSFCISLTFAEFGFHQTATVTSEIGVHNNSNGNNSKIFAKRTHLCI